LRPLASVGIGWELAMPMPTYLQDLRSGFEVSKLTVAISFTLKRSTWITQPAILPIRLLNSAIELALGQPNPKTVARF
jgi:hypothetical protein